MISLNIVNTTKYINVKIETSFIYVIPRSHKKICIYILILLRLLKITPLVSKLFKGTLHSKLTLWLFGWPKSIYYCDLSQIAPWKLELREQGTNLLRNRWQSLPW